MKRKMLLTGVLLVAVLSLVPLAGILQASAPSVGESASYTILLPRDETAVYQTYKTLGVVSTEDGPAYNITSKTECYSYVDGQIGTQLLQRNLGFALISVDTSKLLYSYIDWRWYDERGNVKQHRVTSIKFKYIGKTAIADCVAYILPPEAPEQVTGHFEISDAHSISTQRNTMWYYMLYQKEYKIGGTYKFYGIYWHNEEKIWFSNYDDMKVIEKVNITVEAGTFSCYHFQRQTPWSDWSLLKDEYAMVDSKVTVYGHEPEKGTTLELTTSIIQDIKSTLSNMLSGIQATLNRIEEKLSGMDYTIHDVIKPTVLDILDKLDNAIKPMLSEILGKLDMQFNELKGMLSGIMSTLSNIEYKLEDKPVIHAKEVTIENALNEYMDNPETYYRIDISSTENFQVKAIYFDLNDPDMVPDEKGIDLCFNKIEMIIQDAPHGKYFFMKGDHLFDPPLAAPYTTWELLTQTGVELYPAGSAGDHLQLCVLIEDGSTVTGDETIYLKVIVESAQTAEISLELIPCVPV